jgi:hypothetical protein
VGSQNNKRKRLRKMSPVFSEANRHFFTGFRIVFEWMTSLRWLQRNRAGTQKWCHK